MHAVPSSGKLDELRRGLSPRNSIVEASRVVVCLQLRQMGERLSEAIAGPDPGPLHDARVAGRRLRAGASMFRCLYPGIWERAEEAGRDVTSGLREVRDMDIRAARLRRMTVAARAFHPRTLALVRRLVDETQEERGGSGGLAGLLAGDPTGTLLPAMWRPRTSGAPAAERFVRVRLKELAQRAALSIPLACVEGRGAVQHRLRIRCKALRYSLEMMEWRLGAQAAWRLDTLRKVQDELGEIHDIDVFCGYLAEMLEKGAPRGSGRLKEIDRRLGEERHRHFGRFLDIREELGRAVAPLIF
jgi:CHAD domain-containing protein